MEVTIYKIINQNILIYYLVIYLLLLLLIFISTTNLLETPFNPHSGNNGQQGYHLHSMMSKLTKKGKF